MDMPPASVQYRGAQKLLPQRSVNPNTVRQLVFFGRHMTDDRLIKSANYVRKEITIRLAHRIRDFQKLPFIVGTNPHIEVRI
jgi:pyruvate dehydrogenase kinase 2/3/4